MTRKASQPQSPRHILVFDEDWEFLEQQYGRNSVSHMGVSPAIRAIIHAYVRRLKAHAELLQSSMTEADVENVAETLGDEDND